MKGMALSINIQILVLLLLLMIQGLEANSKVRCRKNERDALLSFKQLIVDPTNRLKSWAGEDCCSWKGVSCSNSTAHVTKLELRSKRYCSHFNDTCLGGQISHSLLNLSCLNHLDLSMNNFSGIGIPEFLGSLKMLRYLNISLAEFTGKVPHSIGNLSRLRYLDLSDNYLAVDRLTFISPLTSLEYLDLSNLNLSTADDWLHSLNMLPSIMELHLYSCSLPSITRLLRLNFTSLAILDMSKNYFNSTISPFLFNITNIQHLDLSDNMLRGHLPSEVGDYKFLEVLRLSYNHLEGKIPERFTSNICNMHKLEVESNIFSGEIGEIIANHSSDCISSSLKTLDLSHNRFSGILPNNLGLFQSVERLYLHDNCFEGGIPESIGRLSSLRGIFLQNNCLNGSIPRSLGKLSKLEVLDVGNNTLEGMVSQVHFSEHRSLYELRMYDNFRLVFNIDPTWLPPFQLQYIDMSSCNLGPRFPQWLKGQTNKSFEVVLNLHNTSISDVIPDWFGNISSTIRFLDLSHNNIKMHLPKFDTVETALTPLTQRTMLLNSNKFEGPVTPFPWDLVALDISNNLLSGQIPQTINHMVSGLRYLSLSNNYLSGRIPSSLCKMKNLESLDLSENQLSGAIPQCLPEMDLLYVLDLSYNEFSGHIPASLGSLVGLMALHLENNNLQGNIPTSLSSMTVLLTLDLSQNAFTGTIPSWIGENLSSLAILNMQFNNFEGQIPTQLCHLASLHILNLANNMMTGTIPPCFGNFSSMIVDVRVFSLFSLLYGLEYSQMGFQDHVVTNVKGRELEYNKTIRFLFSMDLSENNFFGDIPNEIVNLKLLQNLNLSGNNFSGNIPAKIGNLKALESLDFCRNKLSGSIPQSIANLNFLSSLNLSFNNLSGPIPHGNQLQTLDDKSIYMGNNGLCGAPLESCQNDPEQNKHSKPVEENEKDESVWFYCGLSVGFMAGFVGVCSLLYFNNSCRRSVFQLIDKIYNKLWVTVAVKMNKLKRMVNKEEY